MNVEILLIFLIKIVIVSYVIKSLSSSIMVGVVSNVNNISQIA